MEFLKGLNLLIRFFLELASLAALGLWGFGQGASFFPHWTFAAGTPLVFALAWGRWAAPTSKHRLSGFPRLAFEAAAFGSAAWALALTGRRAQALVFTVVVILNIALLRNWKKW